MALVALPSELQLYIVRLLAADADSTSLEAKLERAVPCARLKRTCRQLRQLINANLRLCTLQSCCSLDHLTTSMLGTPTVVTLMVKVLHSLLHGTMNEATLNSRVTEANSQEMTDAAIATIEALLAARPTVDAQLLRPSEMVFVLSIGPERVDYAKAPMCCIDRILQCHVASATCEWRNGKRLSWCSGMEYKWHRFNACDSDSPSVPISDCWGLDFRLREPILHEPNREIPEGWDCTAPKLEDVYDPLVVSMCVVDPNLNRAAVLLHDRYWSHLATLSEDAEVYVGDLLADDPFSDLTHDFTPARLDSGEKVNRDVHFTFHATGRQGTGPDDFAANGFRPDSRLRPHAVAVDRILVQGICTDYNPHKTAGIHWAPDELVYEPHHSMKSSVYRSIKPGEFDGYLRGPELIWFPL